MIKLENFKVNKNSLVHGNYAIHIHPFKDILFGTYLKYIVEYRGGVIFESNKEDSLQDVIETISELEKDDQDYKDRQLFRATLQSILRRKQIG